LFERWCFGSLRKLGLPRNSAHSEVGINWLATILTGPDPVDTEHRQAAKAN
jgi:hypothetical protein